MFFPRKLKDFGIMPVWAGTLELLLRILNKAKENRP
jgi:hypothetical protein